MIRLKKGEFILVCENCGERIELKDNINSKEIEDKFIIVTEDDGRIYITCSSCGNKISF